jgi:hypothetical protein
MEIIRNDEGSVYPIKLSQEEYEQLEAYSAIGYTPAQIAMCLDVDKIEFERQLMNRDSLIYHHYHKGHLESNFQITNKLLENAKTGNITAVEILQKRQESVYLANLKDRIFNGGGY